MKINFLASACLAVILSFNLNHGVVNAEVPRGAKVPFFTYDCDDSKVFQYSSGVKTLSSQNMLTAEAINRTCQALENSGDFVEFESKHDSDVLILRYSLAFFTPHDEKHTLNVYINGKKAGAFDVSTFYIHSDPRNDNDNMPAPKDCPLDVVFRWWEESIITNLSIRSGDKIRIQKDPENKAKAYYLDLVELEKIPQPLGKNGQKPDETWESLTDHGATPNQPKDDDGPALVKCIQKAISSGKRKVWIPAGDFEVHSSIDFPVEAKGLAIEGAGIWHSKILLARSPKDGKNANALFLVNAENLTFKNFKTDFIANFRRLSDGGVGSRQNVGNHFKFNGDGLRLENMWMCHGGAMTWYGGNKGVFINNRVRGTYADAFNLENGATGNLVSNNHIRAAGDDCLVFLGRGKIKDGGHNIFSNNTVECVYKGRFMNTSGGNQNIFENNILRFGSIPYTVICKTRGGPVGTKNEYTTEDIKECVFRNNLFENTGVDAVFNIDARYAGVSLIIEGNTIINPPGKFVYCRGDKNIKLKIRNNEAKGLKGEFVDISECKNKPVVELSDNKY